MKSIIQYDKEIPYIEGRNPRNIPTSYLVKDGTNVVEKVGRRPSKMFLVDGIRKSVDIWRSENYPGISDISKELLSYWFEQDHLIHGEQFYFYFGQREAIETLIYLVEYKKFSDISEVINEYSPVFKKIFNCKAEIVENPDRKRYVKRYFPELEQDGLQELPKHDLIRYAIKMATGSGKTTVMALVIVWAYFHKLRVKDSKLANNFLIIAPNVIVYERLELDFNSGKIFIEKPLIPPNLRSEWNINVVLRGQNTIIQSNNNLFVTNIHQIYESRDKDWTPKNVVDEILGPKAQTNINVSDISVLEQIKSLKSLIVLNDEAHHVHDDTLEWNKTLLSIHEAIGGLSLWLDFSATPKNQNGTYFPWIIVDYPLAQAVEDRIVKSPLIVHRVDKTDPENVTKENAIQAYGDWIKAAIERWKEHFQLYTQVGKKPVLFIMAESNLIADQIAAFIEKDPAFTKEEILLIHTKKNGDIEDKYLPQARENARRIDETSNKIKVVVSVLMLREGWDVQNVSVVLGLRPFTSKAEILPEQGVGRGLRLMRGISPDRTQTLEVMGTKAFEDFVKELEKEGVNINTVNNPPPLPIKIMPIKEKEIYDIEIPVTELTYTHEYRNLQNIEINKIDPLFSATFLSSDDKIKLQMELTPIGTIVHEMEIDPSYIPLSQEILSRIIQHVIKNAGLTQDNFAVIYEKIKEYLINRCFNCVIDLDDETIRKKMRDLTVQTIIINFFVKYIGNLTVVRNKIQLKGSNIILSKTKEFLWRRIPDKVTRSPCKHTIFNLIAAFNDLELNFASFLDKAKDIQKFAALAETYTGFKIDYLSSKGAIRFYYPDFVAIQKVGADTISWIIETKGREFEDVDKKDAAMKKWCEDITKEKNEQWKYIKVPQRDFESSSWKSFQELIDYLTAPKPKQTKLKK